MPRVHDKKEVVPAMAAKAKNPFAALAGLDSDSEEEQKAPVAAPVAPASPPLRTWPTNDKNTSVFNSPFSSKKTRWNKPRFKEDNDGWVSIRWNQPQFQEDNSSVPGAFPLSVQYQPRTPPFHSFGTAENHRSLATMDPDAETKVLEDDSPLYASVTPPNLELGEPIVPVVQEVVLEETITPVGGAGHEQLTALAWAERVKKSLEKAEAARAAKGRPADPKADEDFKEALGRLSFFRRGMVGTSSSE